MAAVPGYLSNTGSGTDATVYNYATQGIGTASPDRVVVVVAGGSALSGTNTSSTATIAGGAATQEVEAVRVAIIGSIYSLPVSSGTTATIALTYASTQRRNQIGILAMTGADPVSVGTDSAANANATAVLTAFVVPVDGCGIFALMNQNGSVGTVTWTNATERFDVTAGAGEGNGFSGADTITDGTNTITADGSTSDQVLVGVAFGPLPDVAVFLESLNYVPPPRRSRARFDAFMSEIDTEPVVAPVSTWGQPFGQPTRRKLPRAQAPFLAYTGADPFPEMVTEDRWHQPLSLPQMNRLKGWRVAAIASGEGPRDITLEPTRADKWWQPLSEPVRVHPRAIARAALVASGMAGIDPFLLTQAEGVSVDRWLIALTDPTRRKVSVAAMPSFAQDTANTAGATPEEIYVDKWFQQLSEPVRTRIAQARVALAASGQPLWDMTGEIFGLDKWWQPFSLPVRNRAGYWGVVKSASGMASISPYGLALAEAVTEDRWHQPFSLPVRFATLPRLRIALMAASGAATDPAVLTLQELVSFDRWAQPLSVPVRRKTRVSAYPSFTRSPFTQPVVVIAPSMASWFRLLSEPPLPRKKRILRTGLQESYAPRSRAPLVYPFEQQPTSILVNQYGNWEMAVPTVSYHGQMLVPVDVWVNYRGQWRRVMPNLAQQNGFIIQPDRRKRIYMLAPFFTTGRLE